MKLKKRKEIWLAAVMAGLTVLVFLFFIHINQNEASVCVGYGATVKTDSLEDRLYLLDLEWHQDEEEWLEVSFFIEEASDLCLYIPSATGAELCVNHEYKEKSAYYLIQLDHASEKEGHVSLRLTSDKKRLTAERYVIYLGTEEAALRALQIETAKGLFVVGMSCAILLFSIVLYMGKRTETYLFWLALLTYTTLVRTWDNTMPYVTNFWLTRLLFLGKFSYLGAQYPILNNNLHRLGMCMVVAYLRYRTLECFYDVKIKNIPFFHYISWVAVIPVIFIRTEVGFYLGTMLLYTVNYLCEGYVLVRGYREQPSASWMLAMAWVLTVALRFFDAGCELFLLPRGFLDLQLRLKGIIESFYSVTFFVLACIRFTGKFVEADRLNLELEKRVQLKTREKTEFVRSMIHNLKTPLFSLSGYVDMAQVTANTDVESTQRYLERINNNVTYVQKLMDRVFLVSQLDEGKVTFQPVPFDLKKMLEEIGEATRIKVGEYNIEVQVDVVEQMPCVGDPIYYQQALQNIADNAVEQIIDGKKGSSVCIKGYAAGTEYIVEIQDDGVGILPENQEKIFERYYSNHHGKRTSSGLGLAITKELVERQGGWIRVESIPGLGATFHVGVKKN